MPKTEEHAEQQNYSMRPEDEWVTDLLDSGTLPGCLTDRPNTAYSNHPDIGVAGLYRHARDTVPALKFASDQRLGRFLKGWGARPWSNGAKRGWAFPPLKELRERWQKERGRPRDWPGGIDAAWHNGTDRDYSEF